MALGKNARGAALSTLGAGLMNFGGRMAEVGRQRKEWEAGAPARQIQQELGQQQIARGKRETEMAEMEAARAEEVARDDRLFKELMQKPHIRKQVEDGIKIAVQQKTGQAPDMTPAEQTPLEKIKGAGLQYSKSPMIQGEVERLRREQAEQQEREQELADVEAQQKFKRDERLESQDFEKGEREASDKVKFALAALKQSNAEAKSKDKPYERKSTTAAAKMTSDLGFALGKFRNLRVIVANGDANVLNTTWTGEFTNPTLKDAILQLTEFHAREQSGAAISASEWKNFENQILNRKYLLTKEGRQAILNNLDDFIGRYYATGEAVSHNPTWFEEYEQSKKAGIQKIIGDKEKEIALSGDKAARLQELRRKQREGTLK